MKKLFIILLSLCVVSVAGFAGQRSYKIWKQRRLLGQARVYTEKGDPANAILSLRLALQTNPNNLEAAKMMGDFTELARSPQSLLWRSRIVELEPDSLSNRVALARVASGMGDAATARKALEGADAASKKTSLYHAVAGSVELTAGRLSEAEDHFSEAARIEPGNPSSALNLASLRLQRTDPTASAEARSSLQALSAGTNPPVRLEALRQLTFDALRHTNHTAALGYSSKVIQETNSGFPDRMLHIDLLKGTTAAQLWPYLAKLQAESTDHSAKAYELAKWILRNDGPGPVLTWLRSLPPATRLGLPVPMIEADPLIAAKDWTTQATNLSTQTWGELDSLRLACRSRAFREQNLPSAAKAEWIQAMKSARARSDVLAQLLNTVALWHWESEVEDVLWAMIARNPNEPAVLEVLSNRLLKAGKTRGLMTLYAQVADGNKTNYQAKNNLAMTALLLEEWSKRPHELSQEVFRTAPTNAAFASTYAYSLLLQKKIAESLSVFEQLPVSQLQEPGISAYYGLALKSAGQTEKSARYLAMAAKGKFLPEEQLLLDRASRSPAP